MPCLTDIRALDRHLNNQTFKTPQFKQEWDQFGTQCFGPAKTKVMKALKSNTGDPEVDKFYQDKYRAHLAANDGKPPDLDNVFSRFYRETPGLYAPCNNPECRNTLQATQPVTGQPHDAIRDAGMSPQQAAANQGQPYCHEWLTDMTPRFQSETRFQNAFYDKKTGRTLKGFGGQWEKIKDIFGETVNSFRTQEEFDEYFFYRAQRALPPHVSSSMYGGGGPSAIGLELQASDSTATSVARALVGGAAFVGLSSIPGVGDIGEQVVGEFVGFYATMYIIKKAAPLMKALVLMMIFGLLPLYLVISEYEVGAVITAMVLIMVVNMFSTMFEVANYLETVMFASLYPGWAVSNATVAYGVEILLIDVLLLLLYVVAPSLMLMMVSMAGQRIAAAGGTGTDATRQTGKMGGNIGGNAPGQAGRGLRKSIGKRGK